MRGIVRTGVAALAFGALAVQPVVANASYCWPCPPAHTASVGDGAAAGMFWAVSFFLCAGMTIGKQDTDAARHHTTASGKQHFGALLACALPPIGFYRLTHGKV
jgi:hypothetical protein